MAEENVHNEGHQTASYWIEHLNLLPHPEGGHYKEVFRSQQEVLRAPQPTSLTHQQSESIKYLSLPANQVRRAAVTSIYYLLDGEDFSGFHKLISHELWYFHKGSPLLVHVLHADGTHLIHELSDASTGTLSLVVPGGLYFASEVRNRQGFSLVSCAVAPGFEFEEFEMAKKETLIANFPQHAKVLERLCRI